MTGLPFITVAPNGARLQRSDHPALPVTIPQIAETARECQAAGADGLHLHVRTPDGSHSLDTGLYREALREVARAAPGLWVQVTTEAAGRYDVADQLHLIETLRPKAASIAVREMARDERLARRVYAAASHGGTQVQHILYSDACFAQLAQWHAQQVIPSEMRDAILVLGQYAPPRAGTPQDLDTLLPKAKSAGLRVTVCAFGPQEQACLRAAAARAGCALRVGFENNRIAPDGTPWRDNAASVAALRAAVLRDQAGEVA